ncbi:hypothetical protein KQ940_06000 [Marinobacterium sp. D7]|uniref:Cthe_2314 family HEPN domain-containing protein n=1 Tax=Marinobacterium ramblicola TaxID=2849041 RepID=UPI001C2CD3FA|nr:Cthe_2314 family HEPN domain-containing protein [Marinobacterium ramblicola]MBV1787604.1 hypothetical protein [Marinobacterium ramblicola]
MRKIEEEIILDKESPIFTAKADGQTLSVDNETYLDNYIILCSKSLTAVTAAITKAELSLNMLNSDLLKKISEEPEFLSSNIEMLIENSIIRVQSIYDRVLILINRILDLGISNEAINHNSLVTNEHVKRFDLVDKLKAINKVCNDYRLVRNTLIHHDRYTEEQLGLLQLVINADYLSKEANGSEFIPYEELDSLITSFLDITKSDLESYLTKITEKVDIIFDSVLPIYNYQKNRLRE